jgi:alanyl-tRNA synthetase
MNNQHDIKQQFISQFTALGFEQKPRVSMLSRAFPTNFTPSGGEEYLDEILAQPDPKGSFCVVQTCFRYQDIDNIKTGFHQPLFEMGVAISVNQFDAECMMASYLSYLETLGIDRRKLTISIFEGGQVLGQPVPRDTLSMELWRKHGIADNQFIFLNAKENFLIRKNEGYAGTKTEVFYRHNGELVEISVLMNVQYQVKKSSDGYTIGEWNNAFTCIGLGFDRVNCIVQKSSSIIDLVEYSSLTKLYNEIYQNHISLSKFTFLSYLVRSFMLLINDGAGRFMKGERRRHTYKRLLWGLRELSISNSFDFTPIINTYIEIDEKYLIEPISLSEKVKKELEEFIDETRN